MSVERFDLISMRPFEGETMNRLDGGDWVRYDDHLAEVGSQSQWIPLKEAKLELWGAYWIKAGGDVLRAPAEWTGEHFAGGGWPLHKSLVSHVIKLTKPEA